MIQKIKSFILITLASSTLLVPALAATLVSTAAADSISNGVCQGVNNAANGNNNGDCGSAGTGATNLSSIAGQIVSIFSIIVGIVAVIMIIYSGFRYITSGGDSGKVGNAKNSLIYALVGLVIVALAQLIVHYVLNTASNAVGSSGIGT
jgi:Type IV secretion system pilin